MWVDIFKFRVHLKTDIYKITFEDPTLIPTRHKSQIHSIKQLILSGSQDALKELKSFTHGLKRSIEISEDLQNLLLDLIENINDYRMIYHLDGFFTSLFKTHLAGFYQSRNFVRYCAKVRHILDHYIFMHFEEVLRE